MGAVKAQVWEADIQAMDLSKVLGDVYETEDRPAPAVGSAPEWADEQRLDEVFAKWTPGPPASAPAAEHEMAAHTSARRVRLDDDLAVALTAALAGDDAVPDVVPVSPRFESEPDAVAAVLYAEPASEPKTVDRTHWTRGNDDVLVGTRRSRFAAKSDKPTSNPAAKRRFSIRGR